MDPSKTLRDAAAAAGVGVLASVLGTAAMEASARGRGSSTTPATAVENALGVEPKSEEHEKRLNNLTHWGYDASLGAPRGLLADHHHHHHHYWPARRPTGSPRRLGQRLPARGHPHRAGTSLSTTDTRRVCQ